MTADFCLPFYSSLLTHTFFLWVECADGRSRRNVMNTLRFFVNKSSVNYDNHRRYVINSVSKILSLNLTAKANTRNFFITWNLIVIDNIKTTVSEDWKKSFGRGKSFNEVSNAQRCRISGAVNDMFKRI